MEAWQKITFAIWYSSIVASFALILLLSLDDKTECKKIESYPFLCLQSLLVIWIVFIQTCYFESRSDLIIKLYLNIYKFHDGIEGVLKVTLRIFVIS